MSKSKTQKPKAKAAAKTAPRKTAAKSAPKPKAKPVAKAPVKKKPAPKAAPTKRTPAAKPAAKAKPAPAKKAPVKKPAAKTTAKAPAPKAAASPAAKSVKKAAAPVPKGGVLPPPPLKKTPAPPEKKAVASSPKAPATAAPEKKAAVAKPAPSAPAAPVAVAVSTPAPAPVVTPPAKPAPAAAPKAAAKSAASKSVLAITAGEPIAPPKPPVVSSEKPVAAKSGALYYDSHMHTPLCKHAWGEPEEYCAQAVKSGLKGIIFTCHCPMPDGFWPSVRMSEGEFDLYLSLVQRAKEAYAGKLEVCLGIESEFFPGYEKYIEGLHQRADFDYCLGGLHWQAKEYLNKFEQGTIEGFRRTYFDHLAASAETGLYDCIAHPDLVKNYHPDSWCFAIIKNTVASVLDRIAKTGVAMELNTSGLNKSYSEMNPGNEMLRMMAERKIPVVIGSDAHKAPRVGEHFVTALNNLAEAGYEEVSYFKKRERIDLKISDVISSIKKAADANA